MMRSFRRYHEAYPRWAVRREWDQKEKARDFGPAPFEIPNARLRAARSGLAGYWIGVPPPPGAICASVGAMPFGVKKIVPGVLVAKPRFPVVPG